MNASAREARSIVRLAAPVVATQLGSMMLLVVDNLMLGHFSVDAFAAAAIGRVWVMGTMMIGFGLLLGLDPIVSQAHGARDAARLSSALQRGLLLALLASLPIGLLWLFTEPVLLAFGQDPARAASAHGYALAQIPAIPFFLGFMTLRGWLQGRRIVRPAMFVVLLANLLNAAANALLIFGPGPFPRLGLIGAGISTSITEIAMFVGLLAVIHAKRLHRGAWKGWRPIGEIFSGLDEIVHKGLPIALHLGLEMWAFMIATLWSGQLGTTALASHNIALNLASVSFMVPLGVSIGASTRVGNLIGAGRAHYAQRAAWVALAIGAGVMALFAVLFILGRELLPRMYTGDAEVLVLAAALLPIAAAFQLFDGTQVVGAGILRGMGTTRPTAVINLIGFYAIGLPLAHYLAFERELGVRGIWWGLCAGLGAVSIALVAWIAVRGPKSGVGS